MADYKHFDMDNRYTIEHPLKSGKSIKEISIILNRSCSSVSREIKRHLIIKKTGAIGKSFNNCKKRFDCNHSFICDNRECRHNFCKHCKICNAVCRDYEEESCMRLSKAPYVCNGCSGIRRCTLKKTFLPCNCRPERVQNSPEGITQWNSH